MQSEFCRHWASAAPVRWVLLSVEEVEGCGRKGGGPETYGALYMMTASRMTAAT